MGDVTGSAKRDPLKVQAWLKSNIEDVNRKYADEIRSPLTVTLGDEFQGVMGSMAQAALAMFDLEEASLSADPPISLHYVILEGQIDTPINPNIAHGMLGSGLTRARALLAAKPTQKRRRPQYIFECADDGLSQTVSLLFSALAGISARWSDRERQYSAALLAYPDDVAAAKTLSRDRTSVYRRRQSLLIEEYRDIRRALLTVLERGLGNVG